MCKKFKQYIFPKDTHGNALEKSLPKIYTKPMHWYLTEFFEQFSPG